MIKAVILRTPNVQCLSNRGIQNVVNPIAKPLYMPVEKECISLRNIHQSPNSRSSTHAAVLQLPSSSSG